MTGDYSRRVPLNVPVNGEPAEGAAKRNMSTELWDYQEMKGIQIRAGCPGCKFCDESEHKYGRPCCTHPTVIKRTKSGKCLERENV
jgi:hypothetical protein